MRDIIVKLPPFEFISIIDCKLVKSLNEHAVLEFTGRISKEQEDAIFNMSMKNTSTSLIIQDEFGKEDKVFTGIVKEFIVENTSDSRVLTLTCISASYLMDVTPRCRIFQNKASTYNDVLNKLNTYNDYGCILSSGDDAPIRDILVQYNETDFEFAKRLAAHFNTSICPAYLVEGVKYYFGIPRSTRTFEISKGYSLKKELKKDLRKDEEKLSFGIEQGNHIVEFSHRDIYEIGDTSTLRGQTYTICEITSLWTGEEMVHHYVLKETASQYVSKYYNHKIIGASLEAHITEVSKDKVKVNVHLDGIQDSVDFIPYSTVYSSPDGTGWYCMPEIGDSIRMYFPTEEEKQGYAISSVHVGEGQGSISSQGGGVPRSNPDHKSLKSKYGKEVLFTPTTLTFTNNNGMQILIDDEEGITITSPLKISINSEEKIDVASAKNSVHVIGTESVLFEQADTAVELKDSISIKGAQTLVE